MYTPKIKAKVKRIIWGIYIVKSNFDKLAQARSNFSGVLSPYDIFITTRLIAKRIIVNKNKNNPHSTKCFWIKNVLTIKNSLKNKNLTIGITLITHILNFLIWQYLGLDRQIYIYDKIHNLNIEEIKKDD